MLSAVRSDTASGNNSIAARFQAPLQVRPFFGVLLASLVALGLAGCGSGPSTSPTGYVAGSQITYKSSMVPHRLPLSPADTGGIIDLHQTTQGKKLESKSAIKSGGSGANTVHWFYLINGEGIPGGVTNTTTPPGNWIPNVLTVNGAAPGGAPNPNGGTGVGIAAMNPASNGSQLWKAVAATTSGYVYLRSAESFTVNNALGFSSTTNNTNWPNLLVGYGATAMWVGSR